VTLPVERVLPELLDALHRHGTAVLVSPPGTGKTTLVPLAMRAAKRVVVAEPRRVAARAAARRMASLLNEPVGPTVGYTVRGDRKVGPRTEIEVVTTGVLVQRLQRDPDLPGVGAVILDECHERHLDTDLALAFLVDVRANLRPDLQLLATSATADAERLARILGAMVIEAPTVLYPVDEVWRPPDRPFTPPQGTKVDPRLLDHVAATIRTVTQPVLAFLPGVGEINAVKGRLGDGVATLHGRLPAAAQDAVLRNGARVVLATSVAESSLTVPGVRVVVDAGLAREPRTDYARGLGHLVTVRESKATATQRAGRAGREAPGTVYRLWSPADHERLPDHAQPEIAIADLTGFALALANWGHPDGTGLALPDPPPAAALEVARQTLHALGAVDDGGRITGRGRQMATIGAHPRLARALLDGGEKAAEVVALLEDDTLPITSDDLEIALKTMHSKAWRDEVRRLRMPAKTRKTVGAIVAEAYPERIAKRRREGTYLMAGGTAAELAKGSALAGVEWLAIAVADRPVGHTDARIRLAVAIDETTARQIRPTSTVDESGWVDGKLIGRRIERLGAIIVKETPLADPPFTVDGLKLEWLNWTSKAISTRQRLAFLHATYGAPWPDVSDAALLARAPEWIDGKDVNLRRLVPNNRLDELAPEKVKGRRVNYDDPTAPTIAVKVQDAFGWTEAPKIGNTTVLVHLLSPAGRPVAVTRDLESFWRTGYPQVRAELRGRYPRHNWPSQPGADRPA
jgi:ATP-dependent helicase HrpB